MDTKRYTSIVIICLLSVVFTLPLFAAQRKDPCKKEGIVVKNLTLSDDLWYKMNHGDCTIWRRGHIFAIRPEDTIEIFSDLVCKTPYCPKTLSYPDYLTSDSDGNCRVRILPGCTISDME